MSGVLLALSGGGVKAAAHLGVIRALVERGLRPARVVGTSMGAVVGAAWAAGVPLARLEATVGEAAHRGIARSRSAAFLGLAAPALMRPEPLRRAIEAFVPARSFAEMVTPLTVTATDLDTRELVLFGADGEAAPVVDALMASAALPLFYPPVRVGGRRCGDGGLRGVLPLAAAATLPAELVVAVDVGSGLDEPGAGPPHYPSLLRAQHEGTGILMAANTALELELWRRTAGRPRLLYLRPNVAPQGTFRPELAATFVDEGYRTAIAALDREGL